MTSFKRKIRRYVEWRTQITLIHIDRQCVYQEAFESKSLHYFLTALVINSFWDKSDHAKAKALEDRPCSNVQAEQWTSRNSVGPNNWVSELCFTQPWWLPPPPSPALITITEPPHDKTNNMACAPSQDSDQPGHPPRLIRVFAVHSMGS